MERWTTTDGRTGAPVVYEFDFITGRDLLGLVSRFTSVCGGPLVDFIGGALVRVQGAAREAAQAKAAEVAAGKAKDGDEADAAVKAMRSVALDTLLKQDDVAAQLARPIASALANPEAASLVRDLLRFARRNGMPLSDDGVFDLAYNGNPWEPFVAAVRVCRVNGFFSAAGTFGGLLGA